MTEKSNKSCSICNQKLPGSSFIEKGRDGNYCELCNDIHSQMIGKQTNDLPTLEIGEDINYLCKLNNRNGETLAITYDEAKQLVNEKVAYIYHPTLIKDYFDKGEFRKLCFMRYGYKCLYCGGHANTIDHVVPVSRGGITSFSNCVPACRRCNELKDDMYLDDYFHYFDPQTLVMCLTKVKQISHGVAHLGAKVNLIKNELKEYFVKVEDKKDILCQLQRLIELERMLNIINKAIAKFELQNSKCLKGDEEHGNVMKKPVENNLNASNTSNKRRYPAKRSKRTIKQAITKSVSRRLHRRNFHIKNEPIRQRRVKENSQRKSNPHTKKVNITFPTITPTLSTIRLRERNARITKDIRRE